jgi:hypothetical protein
VASFLRCHGEEQRMLPALVIIEPARTSKLAVDSRSEVVWLLFFGTG